MPQQRGDTFETARKLGHVPIIENELVQEELNEFETREVEPDEVPIEEYSVYVDALDDRGVQPDYLLSIDGSPQEVPTNDDYPNNRIGFIQIAAVLTNLGLIDQQEEERFVDPSQVQEIDESSLQDIVLPSSNYTVANCGTTIDSWRKKLFDTFHNREIEGESMMEIFLKIIEPDDRSLGDRRVDVYRCPNQECPTTGDRPHIVVDADTGGTCDECGVTVYPTDALRTHERVNQNQPNQTAITAIMNVIEHLILCGYLLYLHNQSPERLSRVGFIMDGPLAIFDTPAWLHEPIQDTIDTVYEQQWEQGYSPPLIVGIEKSGSFRDHADNVRDKMDENSILGMDNEYIYEYVMSGTTDLEYGSKTYYGQKFIFRPDSDRVFVLTIPKVANGPQHDPHNYPMMRKTVETLTRVETALYDDATIPVTLAHQHASIPLKTGSRVLELFSREITEANGS
jgi:hypothetical protein